MYSNIIFLSNKNDGSIGSDKLRVNDIITYLINENLYTNIYKFNQIDNVGNANINLLENLSHYDNSIFVWVWTINIDIINKLNRQNKNIIHIYDIIDNYIYNFDYINNILNHNLIHGIIVNNNFMRNEIKKNINYTGRIFIIYHHCDNDYNSIKLINQEELSFGYMGSIKSLKHTDNFLYFNELSKIYPIKFIDTEDWIEYTKEIKNNLFENILSYANKYDKNNIYLNFNCHISIRKNNTRESLYKTTAKIATAAFFNHNIITTLEESVKDILPLDYPFILQDTNYDTIINMFNIIITDYNSNKILWNKGLKIMEDVKKKLNLNNVINGYINMFKLLELNF